MKGIFFIVTFLAGMHIGFAADNVEAKRLIENSQNKLSLKNVHLNLEMETIDKKNVSKSKRLMVTIGEFGEERRVMIEFVSPEKVSGTKILTSQSPNGSDIIEIYMPSTGKVQKIKANQRNVKIMGSEIPVSQFSNIIESDFNFDLLGKEVIEGKECHKIKIDKVGKKEYGIAYVSVEKELLLRVERYNSKDKLITVTDLSEYLEVNNSDKKVYPGKINVKNIKTGKLSNVKVHEVSYLTQVDIEDFQISPMVQ